MAENKKVPREGDEGQEEGPDLDRVDRQHNRERSCSHKEPSGET